MSRKEIKNFKTSRDGKTALRNYIRKVMKRKMEWNSNPNHNWTDGYGEFHDVTQLADRYEITIVKWCEKEWAALVVLHDKTKPLTFQHCDGNSYKWFHLWNDIEFYKVWEIANDFENHILFQKHFK